MHTRGAQGKWPQTSTFKYHTASGTKVENYHFWKVSNLIKIGLDYATTARGEIKK